MYVPLDVNFPDDDKIIAAGLDGAGLYAQALCVAKRMEKDGRLTRVHLHRLGGTDALIDHLVQLDLLHDDGEDVWITAWLDHNESSEELNQRRAKDAQRKRTTRKNRPAGQSRTSAERPVGGVEGVQSVEIETEREIETEKNIAPASPPRQRDLLFEAMCDACSLTPSELTTTERGALNKALKDLRDVDATPAAIRIRAANYRSHWPDITLTPSGLAKRWGQCAKPGNPAGSTKARGHAALERVVGAVDTALAHQPQEAIGQ